MAKEVLKVQLAAGMILVFSPIVLLHASRYELAPVKAQIRPMREKAYPDNPPIVAMNNVAGRTADGASPNAAIPTYHCILYTYVGSNNIIHKHSKKQICINIVC